MNYNEELNAILNDDKPKTMGNSMKNELLKRLDELRDIAESSFQSGIEKPKMSQHYYLNSILSMDLNSRDKVLLVDMLINDSSVKGTEAQVRCNMTKTEYNNGARSLIKQGYTVKTKCGHYSVNSNIY